MTDWERIREKYLSTDISFARLAEEAEVNYQALCRRARKEKWNELKKTQRGAEKENRMERVTVKLLEKMEIAIDKSDEMDSKEIKAMTGALKELRELQRDGDESDGGGKRLEVCFVGETEELSR